MDNYTQIYLKGYGYLDVAQEIPIPLNYSLAEVKDITKRNSSYSKTIILPGTKNNNEKLGLIFDINLSFNDCTYKINRKVEAVIFQSGQPVLSGWFKLISINKLSPSDISFDENIQYECIVFSNQAGIYDRIKDLDISEIDLSAYNHILSFSAITASTLHTCVDVYKYIWHYTAENKYRVGDFRPAVYVKAIWDEIFDNAGFTYTSSFLNQAPFTKLLLPTNTRDLLISDEEVEKRSMRVSFPTNYNVVGINNWTRAARIITNNSIGPTWLYNEPTNITANNDTLSQFVRLRFNDETTGINFDGAYDNYNTSTFTFTAEKNGQYEMDFNLAGQIKLTAPQKVFYPLDTFSEPNFQYREDRLINDMGRPGVQFTAEFQLQKASATTWTNMNSFVYQFIPPLANLTPNGQEIFSWGIQDPQPFLPSGTTAFDYTFVIPKFLVDLEAGDRVRIFIRALSYRTVLLDPIYTSTPPRGMNNSVAITYNMTINGYNSLNSYWKVTAVKNNLTTGDEINLNDIVPQKIKQVDFIKSIVNMFNLYLIADEDKPNNIIIKTRDEYYDDAASQFVDWTDKIDYSQDYNVQLLSELQNKTINFTYKEPKDDVNIRYKEQVGLLYGQYRLNFDNDFLNGEQKIELMFEPTPLVKTLVPLGDEGSGFIVSYFVYQNNSNPKILYDGGVINVSGYTMVDGSVNRTLNYYSYAGHFDNPTNPTIDINWNTNEFYFYNEVVNSITDNTLFNRYWYKYIELISQSKLLTAFFNLNEYDIATLDFAKLVWIRDSYWYVNRIIDYNGNTQQLTKVELIKALDYPKFNPKTTTKKPRFVDAETIKPWTATGGLRNSDNTQPGFTRNTNYGSNIQLVGFDNNIRTGVKNARLLGDGNVLSTSSKGVLVDGDNNFVGGGSYKINIQGNNNTLYGGNRNISLTNSSDVTILYNVGDITATGLENEIIDTIYSRTYISPYVYIQDGRYVNNSNIVDGILDGEITFFSPPPIPPVNYEENLIEGGEDRVFIQGVQGADLLNGVIDGVRINDEFPPVI